MTQRTLSESFLMILKFFKKMQIRRGVRGVEVRIMVSPSEEITPSTPSLVGHFHEKQGGG